MYFCAFSCIAVFMRFHSLLFYAFSCIFMHFHGLLLCIFVDFDSFSWILIHFHAFLCIFTRFCLYALSSSRNFQCVIVSPAIFSTHHPFGAFFPCIAVGFLCSRPRSKELWLEERPAAGCLGVLGIKSPVCIPKGGLGKAGRVLLRLLPKYPILGKKWGIGGLQQQLPGLTRR